MATTIEDLRKWNDGQTVCPPCLVGDYTGLAEWSIDALSAIARNVPLPDPEDYRSDDAEPPTGAKGEG